MRTARPDLDLGADAPAVEVVDQGRDGAELEIAVVDEPDYLGFSFIDDKLPVPDLITERDGAAHPQALLLRCCNFVADAFASHLAFELCE